MNPILEQTQYQQQFLNAAAKAMAEPFSWMQPDLALVDGEWQAAYGDLVGKGNSPSAAVSDFNRRFREPINEDFKKGVLEWNTPNEFLAWASTKEVANPQDLAMIYKVVQGSWKVGRLINGWVDSDIIWVAVLDHQRVDVGHRLKLELKNEASNQ